MEYFVQTFLPYPDFHLSAKSLDMRRLGKQRIEALQIYNTLVFGSRWKHHPAVLMWAGFERALQLYMDECIKEWIRRGYKNNMKLANPEDVKMPPWLGTDRFHSSHRSNLLRKDFNWYSQFGWKEPNDLSYFWPVKN